MQAIHLHDLGKAYRSYPRRWGRAAEWLSLGTFHQLHWVLRNVSLGIAAGESVGIIGRNGAGKSTLLKLITGVVRPTEGSVQSAGRVAALLELGLGFHPDFTGRQNVIMAGQIQGMSLDEIGESLPEIEAFAEIGSYIDEPVRTYSTGMQVRLAFSVATARRPDILIVDEALAVGDIYFQQKCFERISRFRQAGTTLLFVSHSMPTILNLCDRALLLRDGAVVYDGSPKIATDLFQSDVLVSLDRTPAQMSIVEADALPPVEGVRPAPDATENALPTPGTGSIQTSAATFSGVRLTDQHGAETHTLVAEETVNIEIRYALHRAMDDPHVGFKIRDRFGTVLFETNSYCMGSTVGPRKDGESVAARFTFAVLLAPGEYTLTVGLANRGYGEGFFEEALSFEHDVHAFTVLRAQRGIVWSGLINLRPSLAIVE